MTSAPDRKEIIVVIDEAIAAGGRQRRACEELGLSPITLQRWKDPDGIDEDARPGAKRPAPVNLLSAG